MVRLFGIFLFLGLALLVACSDDDPVGPDTDPVSRFVASTTATEPTMSSPDEPTWSSVTGTTVDLNTSGAIAKTNAAATSVAIKAIVRSGILYLRLEWTDDSLNIWRDAWSLINNTSFNFTRNFVFDEDQVFVMFKMPHTVLWDVWNWRVLTTGGAGLAEGKTFNDTSFVSDVGSQTPVKENARIIDDPRPRWIHTTKSAYTDPILFLSESVEAQSDFGPGWQTGMRVAGWVIDLSVRDLLIANPQSRWDIEAVDSYNAETNKYKLVLARNLYTGFYEDIDLRDFDSVQIKVGVVDNQDEIGVNNNSSQRFSDALWLVLP